MVLGVDDELRTGGVSVPFNSPGRISARGPDYMGAVSSVVNAFTPSKEGRLSKLADDAVTATQRVHEEVSSGSLTQIEANKKIQEIRTNTLVQGGKEGRVFLESVLTSAGEVKQQDPESGDVVVRDPVSNAVIRVERQRDPTPQDLASLSLGSAMVRVEDTEFGQAAAPVLANIAEVAPEVLQGGVMTTVANSFNQTIKQISDTISEDGIDELVYSTSQEDIDKNKQARLNRVQAPMYEFFDNIQSFGVNAVRDSGGKLSPNSMMEIFDVATSELTQELIGAQADRIGFNYDTFRSFASSQRKTYKEALESAFNGDLDTLTKKKNVLDARTNIVKSEAFLNLPAQMQEWSVSEKSINSLVGMVQATNDLQSMKLSTASSITMQRNAQQALNNLLLTSEQTHSQVGFIYNAPVRNQSELASLIDQMKSFYANDQNVVAYGPELEIWKTTEFPRIKQDLLVQQRTDGNTSTEELDQLDKDFDEFIRNVIKPIQETSDVENIRDTIEEGVNLQRKAIGSDEVFDVRKWFNKLMHGGTSAVIQGSDGEDQTKGSRGIDEIAQPSFVNALQQAENSVKAGFNERQGAWFPHKSLEGGSDTIGYGHKMNNPVVTIEGEKVDLRKGITEDQAQALFEQDLVKHTSIAQKEWDKASGQDISFQELDPKYKSVLVNIAFNVGSLSKGGKWAWPALARAMSTGDDEGVRREMVTGFTNTKGEKVRLTNRAEQIALALGI